MTTPKTQQPGPFSILRRLPRHKFLKALALHFPADRIAEWEADTTPTPIEFVATRYGRRVEAEYHFDHETTELTSFLWKFDNGDVLRQLADDVEAEFGLPTSYDFVECKPARALWKGKGFEARIDRLPVAGSAIWFAVFYCEWEMD